jgi:hypothetical protein
MMNKSNGGAEADLGADSFWCDNLPYIAFLTTPSSMRMGLFDLNEMRLWGLRRNSTRALCLPLLPTGFKPPRA